MPDQRPAPPITVVVPGRGAAPAELLAVGAPAARRPPLPGRIRGLAGAVLLVLGTGVATAVDQRDRPAPARTTGGPGFPGVSATVQLEQERELVTEVQIDVVVAGGSTGRGDTGGSPEPERLRLVDVTARGFQVRLTGRSAPLVLGEIGRFGSGLKYVVPLGADVVVVDCSVEVGAQRRLTLALQRGNGPVLPVAVQGSPVVVRALDDLVRRTCRRPRG